ncbi:hypothetical protein EPUS_02705 [Endocarpon pusillum Z07020]|uniref:Uncharacterized protein n=1 Tax=Endocarpon pusillum (strain Z07020 / HMAS-L-300199) TaxID=1263415 RepID=U1HHC8_ENDPU|nr:uncharacterized protein EPUS_02705 [Endocarpon pusillum Z07020]ERF68249.1 hypothetical protein EPUS_02705 [Endocarpon pusillum Z07020]
MSVDPFNKDCPDYEKPYRQTQRAQLLLTQISFKHEQPLIWHAAHTLFTQFADTKEAKDICYRYMKTRDTSGLAGIFKTENWAPKMNFHIHPFLHEKEAKGDGNSVIHVHLSEQEGSRLACTCKSGRAITFFPKQYSQKPFGNQILTSMVIAPGMSIGDIGTSISVTATHETTHAFLKSEDHKLALQHCPVHYQQRFPWESEIRVYGDELCVALARSPDRYKVSTNAETLTYILLAAVLTLMHEDLDFSTEIVTKRDKPLAYIKEWRERTGFGWKGPKTYLQGMPDGYGYAEFGMGG